MKDRCILIDVNGKKTNAMEKKVSLELETYFGVKNILKIDRESFEKIKKIVNVEI